MDHGRVGGSALSTAQFSHGFNMGSQNVTDGAGLLRYSVPRARVQRCLACRGARMRHIRDSTWRPLAPVRRRGEPQGKPMSQSDDNQILYAVRIDILPEIHLYVIQLGVYTEYV
jgi:hypothetical protein